MGFIDHKRHRRTIFQLIAIILAFFDAFLAFFDALRKLHQEPNYYQSLLLYK